MILTRLYGDIDKISEDILNAVSITYIYYDEKNRMLAATTYRMSNCCPQSIEKNEKVLQCFPNSENTEYVLIQFENRQYGFACAQTGDIFPYYFDYATHFDKDGYALVARNGKVNIMNISFEVFDIKNNSWASLTKLGNDPIDFMGYDDISWHNENYLVKIWNLNLAYSKIGEICFVGKDGKLMTFKTFKMDQQKIESTTTFNSNATNDFNLEHAMLLDDGALVFGNGTYATSDDVPFYLNKKLSFTKLSLIMKNKIR